MCTFIFGLKYEHNTQGTKSSASSSETEVIYLSKSAKSSEDRVYQNKGHRDVEKNTSGAYRSFCDQIMGDKSNMGNWNISGSQCELNSVPTSPTKSVDTSSSERYQRQISSESSVSCSTSRSKNKDQVLGFHIFLKHLPPPITYLLLTKKCASLSDNIKH